MGIELVTSAPLPFLLSIPETVADGAPMPILCFLHGHDEGAPMEIRSALTRHGPLRPSSAPVATRELIVVAPQLPRRGDHWLRHAADVLSIVRSVRAAHGGDAWRTYLTGFSFGGNGVFDLGFAQPGAWAALWAVDPTRVPRDDPGAPVWLSIGSTARRLKETFVGALRLRHAAGAAPHGARIWEDEGEDHVCSATRAYADERIYAWLLAKSLPDAGV